MKPTRLAWCVGAVLIIAWAILGVFYDHNTTALTWTSRIGQGGATVAALVFILLYTVLGLAGGAKWWKNDVGTNIVWMEIAVVCSSGILAWAFIFNHGELVNPVLGWIYIGGLLAAALVIAWRSVIWLRADRYARRHGHEAPGTGSDS